MNATDPFPPLPAATPPPQRSPLKWIFIGCGCAMLAGIVGVAGCGVAAYLFVKKQLDRLVPVGETYLRSDPAVEKDCGAIRRVERTMADFAVKTDARGTWAKLAFTFDGEKASGEATLWYRREGEAWVVMGHRIRTADGRTLEAGSRYDD